MSEPMIDVGNRLSDKEIASVVDAIGSLSEEDIKEILAMSDPIAWTEYRRVLKGEPFSFKDREYLFEPYRDDFHQLFFMKGRQVEMSEFSMNWLLRKLDVHPYTVGLHAFPRSAQCQKFSKQRLGAAITDSEYLNKWYADRESEQLMRKFTREKNEKGLQPHNFYILGATWQSHKDTVGDASRGISLDFIVYDERQDHPNDVETVLGEGASHSKYKQSLTLGTPKLPGIQFDQQWNASDKRYWYVKCEHCGRNYPISEENILEDLKNEGHYYYGCPKCRNVLNRSNGKWEITNPQKLPEYHGYHINQLMVAWITADEIMRKKNSVSYTRRRFHNEVLGEAYGGDDLPITNGMMMACADNTFKLGESNGSEHLYAGIDWGSESWGYLQNKAGRLIDCHIAGDGDPREQPKSMARFIKKYGKQVKKVVCDAGPDITRFYILRDTLKELGVKCEVWACYYTAPPAKADVTWNSDQGTVTVGRSEIIEQVIDEITDCRMVLPGNDIDTEKMDTLVEHFTSIAAEKNTNNAGNEYIQYVNTGPDHFLHAKIYATVASGGAVSTILSGTVGPVNNPRKQKSVSGAPQFNVARTSTSCNFPVFNRRKR